MERGSADEHGIMDKKRKEESENRERIMHPIMLENAECQILYSVQ